MTILATVPGTTEWLLAQLDLGAQLALRSELRRAVRDLDAIFAGLWTVERSVNVRLIEFAGDRPAAPRRLPELISTAPSYETVLDADGVEHDAVVHRPRLGRGMPELTLVMVDASAHRHPALLDAVEACGERLEEIIVAAVAGAGPGS